MTTRAHLFITFSHRQTQPASSIQVWAQEVLFRFVWHFFPQFSVGDHELERSKIILMVLFIWKYSEQNLYITSVTMLFSFFFFFSQCYSHLFCAFAGCVMYILRYSKWCFISYFENKKTFVAGWLVEQNLIWIMCGLLCKQYAPNLSLEQKILFTKKKKNKSIRTYVYTAR